MPRNQTLNEALREQSRRKILYSAGALFARHGYAATSVRMIAREAGVAQGLLYNYFAGKEELLRALFTESMDQVRQSFAAADAATDPREALEDLIRSSFALVQQHRPFWQLTYSLRGQPDVLADLRDELDAWTHTILATLERLLRATGMPQPEIEAAILFALIDGIAQHYVANPDSYPLSAVIDAVVARYTHREESS